MPPTGCLLWGRGALGLVVWEEWGEEGRLSLDLHGHNIIEWTSA